MIVSIVTPTFNAVTYLRECIESVQRNERPGIEIEHVIADAGSTDGTVELAESYGVRVLKGQDRGIFDGINKGFFNSSGELIGYVGGDDVMLPDGVELAVKAYKKRERRWVVGGCHWIDPQSRYLGGLAAPPTWMTARMFVCIGWNPLMQQSTFFTPDFYSELNGCNIEYKDSGDYELFARAMIEAPFERVPQALACFRRTTVNNSAVNVARTLRENTRILETYGPKSTIERLIWKYMLKLWFNGVNPGWSTRKIMRGARIRLGLPQEQY